MPGLPIVNSGSPEDAHCKMNQKVSSDVWNLDACICRNILFDHLRLNSREFVVQGKSLQRRKLGQYPVLAIDVQDLFAVGAEDMAGNLSGTLEHTKRSCFAVIANADWVGYLAALWSTHSVDRSGQKMALLQFPVFQTQFAFPPLH